jgi:hypothetical protein
MYKVIPGLCCYLLQIRSCQLVLFQALTATSMNVTAFWNVASCSLVKVAWRRWVLPPSSRRWMDFITLMTEAVGLRTSETSVYFHKTKRRYIPEGCNVYVNMFVSHRDLVISLPTEWWLISQKGLCFMKLRYLVIANTENVWSSESSGMYCRVVK